MGKKKKNNLSIITQAFLKWESGIIRVLSKPSTAQCNLDTYTSYLIAESKYGGCSRLGKICGMSHDCVNRFLERENYTPFDLFNEIKNQINLIDGTLSVDDTVIEKIYSDPKKAELIGYFWSGKHHKAIKGINLITLYYTDGNGHSFPVNYRIYNYQDNKSKNDYAREMIKEVIQWGIKAKNLTSDCWYSSRENLHFFKNQELNFLVGIAKNRNVKLDSEKYVPISTLDIPKEGLIVTLKEFGLVKVFKRRFKNGTIRYYAIFASQQDNLEELSRQNFQQLHSLHWGIECYHRALKQLCNISKFQVRITDSIKTHIFCSIRAFTQLEILKIKQVIESWYEIQWQLYIQVAKEFITEKFQQKMALAV
jgi:hypothetical protein